MDFTTYDRVASEDVALNDSALRKQDLPLRVHVSHDSTFDFDDAVRCQFSDDLGSSGDDRKGRFPTRRPPGTVPESCVASDRGNGHDQDPSSPTVRGSIDRPSRRISKCK